MTSRHAVPLLPSSPNAPLLRATPNLGWQLVRLAGRVSCEVGLTEKSIKSRVKWGCERFINWMVSQGHIFKGGVEVDGPFNHVGPEATNLPVQHGDAGGMRLLALEVPRDAEHNGLVDYEVSAVFLVKEHIAEVQVDDRTNPNTILNPNLRAAVARAARKGSPEG